MKSITKAQAIQAYPGIIQSWLFSRDKSITEATTELCQRAFAKGLRPVNRILSTSAVSRWRRAESKVPMWAISVVVPDLLASGWSPSTPGEWATVAQGLLAYRLQERQYDLADPEWQKHFQQFALQTIDEVISEYPNLEKSTFSGWLNSVASDAESMLSARQLRDHQAEDSSSE